MKLHHVAVVCRSEEHADQFCGRILGLKRIKSSQLQKELARRIFDIEAECQLILYGNEMLSIEVFVPVQIQNQHLSFEHICLEVENREVLLAKCRESGLTVKEITKGDSIVTFIADFDGNLFEIKENKRKKDE